MADFRIVLACLAAWCARATQPANPVTITETMSTTSASLHRSGRRFLFSQTVEFTGFGGTAEQAEDGLERGLEDVLELVSSHLLEGPGSLEVGGPVQVSEITPQRRTTATDARSKPAAGRKLSTPSTPSPKMWRATFDIVVTGSAFADEILAAARVVTPFQVILRDLDPQIVTSSVSSTDLQELPETTATSTMTTNTIGVLLDTSRDQQTQASPVMIGLLASVGAVFVLAGATAFIRKRRAAMKGDKMENEKSSSETLTPPSNGNSNNVPGVDSIRNDLDFDVNRTFDIDIDLDSNNGMTVTQVDEPGVKAFRSEWSGSVGSERSQRSLNKSRSDMSSGSAASKQSVTVEWGIDKGLARPSPRTARDVAGRVADRVEIVDPSIGGGLMQKTLSVRSTMSDASTPKRVEVRLTVASDPSNFSI